MEHPQAPFTGPGGYGVNIGNPFAGVGDSVPRHYYLETAAAMKAAFPEQKAATGNPASRITRTGITVSASGGQVLLQYGTSWIPVTPDVMEELINDIRVVMKQVTTDANYRPGAGMTVPAGSDPMANDASSAFQDMQGGGGNNARTTATSSGGNSPSWLDRMRGQRPPIVRGGMDGMMGDNLPGV